MGRSAELHLRVPGLLGPVPGPAARALPAYPALARLMSRGRKASTPSLFQGDSPAPGPIALLGAGGEPGEHFWFRARGVHLRADRDRLLLFAGAGLRPEIAEAEELRTAFNRHFADRSLMLETVDGEWFLRCRQPPRVQLDPLDAVAGRPLNAHLPEGPDAADWRAVLNEVQMLFHTQPANQRREQAGQPAINGLWVWGGGRLAGAKARTALASAYSDCLETRGLARLAGLQPMPEPAGWDALEAWQGTCLVELQATAVALQGQDLDSWEQSLADLERDWAAPLAAALGARTLGRLVLDVGTGDAWEVTGGDLRRFWRRARPLSAWLETGGDE